MEEAILNFAFNWNYCVISIGLETIIFFVFHDIQSALVISRKCDLHSVRSFVFGRETHLNFALVRKTASNCFIEFTLCKQVNKTTI